MRVLVKRLGLACLLAFPTMLWAQAPPPTFPEDHRKLTRTISLPRWRPS